MGMLMPRMKRTGHKRLGSACLLPAQPLIQVRFSTVLVEFLTGRAGPKRMRLNDSSFFNGFPSERCERSRFLLG